MLGIPALTGIGGHRLSLGRGREDSNPQPTALKAAVLPLNYTPGGLEPNQGYEVDEEEEGQVQEDGAPGEPPEGA